MLKNVHIKLTRVSATAGPFSIYDEYGNLIAENVSREDLINGIGYLLDDDVNYIRIVSTGDCPYEKVVKIKEMTEQEFYQTDTELISTSCAWRHLTNIGVYNSYYGAIKPYVIEYPFSYEYFDQIVQNVKDFTRAYKYITGYDAVFSTATHIEVDDYFNKAIIYNGQQCSGLLELVSKPLHDLSRYSSYPVYNSDSKTILFTKSGSFYNYNTFWDILVNKLNQMFLPSCESMSVDKELNQSNMDYGKRSFNKPPIRGKDVKIRHILDDRSDLHLVSRLLIVPTQISFK